MSKLPPPFIVGETYLDRDGEYLVTDIFGNDIEIQRPNGKRLKQDGRTKANIHRSILADLKSVRVQSNGARSEIGPRPKRAGILEEMYWCIAEIIEQKSKSTTEYIRHGDLAEALTTHSYAGPLIAYRSAHDAKDPSWFASDYVAFYSKEWTEGKPRYADRFERTNIGGKWAYRVRP